MGSYEMNELRQGIQKTSSHEEQLELFFEIQKRDRERKIATTKLYDAGASRQAPGYEYMNSSEGSPLAGGSAMEAQVAARLARSLFFHGSKPILRYASKRNSADLLTSDIGKTDYDWLKTPPATPFNNSIDYSNDAALENSNSPARLHILALLQEVDAKNVAQRLETSVIPNNSTSSSNSAAVADADRMQLNRKSDENGRTKLAISSSPDNATMTMHSTDDGVNRSHTMGNEVAFSNLETKTVAYANERDSSVNSLAKGYSNLGNPRPAYKESLRFPNPTSRFSELPSIVTNLSTVSHAYKGTAVSTSSASTTPKADRSSNAKRSTGTNAPSRMPTTPTKSSKVAADNGGKTRPTSRGRGAINISSNTGASRSTNKVRKDSKSTSSSRQGSPETAHAFSEYPGFTTEAPPNLCTTVSTRSTSTTRSSRSTSNSRGLRQPMTPTNRSNNNDNTIRNTSRSTSASKVRLISTSKLSDVKTRTDGTTAIASKTSRASNNKGAISSNILGSSMVDKVIQARHAAASTSSAPKLSSSSPLSTSSLSSSSSSSSLSLKSAPSMSSSLSMSSTSSLLSLPSTLSTSSSLSSPRAALTSPSSLNSQAKSNESRSSQLRHNKDTAKQQASSTASISPSLLKGDTNSGLNSSRLNQSSKARPMPRSGEGHQSEVIVQRSREVQAIHLRNLLQVEDTIDHARQSNVGNAEHRNVGRKPRELERQYQKQLQQQYEVNEASSDFSNELNEIMRQDRAHYQYGAFPPKDILNMSTSKNPTTSIAKEVEHKHKKQPRRQMSKDSSDFSGELNAIMRQDTAHYHAAVFPPKDIMKVSNNWMLNSPDCSMRDDSVELMHLFMCGIEKYGISESPLVCQHGAPGNCDKCNNAHGKGFKSTTEVWKASPLKHSRFNHNHPNDLQKGSPF